MQNNFMEHEENPKPFYRYLRYSLWGMFKAAANVGKYFFAPLGGISAMIDVYNIYRFLTKPFETRRISKIIASTLSFCANAFFTIGSVLSLLNPVGLAVFACSAAIPSLIQSSYALYRENKNIKKFAENPVLLDESVDEKFKNQCKTIYRSIKLAGNILLFSGLFFAPLLIAGAVLLGGATILEHVEQKNNFRLARYLSQLFSKSSEKQPPSPRVAETELSIAPRYTTSTQFIKKSRHPRYDLQTTSPNMQGIKELVEERLQTNDRLNQKTRNSDVKIADIPKPKKTPKNLTSLFQHNTVTQGYGLQEQYSALQKNAAPESTALKRVIKPASRTVP